MAENQKSGEEFRRLISEITNEQQLISLARSLSRPTSTTSTPGLQTQANQVHAHGQTPQSFAFHTSGNIGGNIKRKRPFENFRAKKQKLASTGAVFLKEVVLLEGPKASHVPKQGKREEYHQRGHIMAMVFQKNWDLEEIKKAIKDAFKLPDSIRIEILMPCGKSLVPPTISGSLQFNGSILYQIFTRKSIYIRPSETILQCELLDDDDDDDDDDDNLPQLEDLRTKRSYNTPAATVNHTHNAAIHTVSTPRNSDRSTSNEVVMSNNMLVQSSMSEVPSTNRFTSVNSSTSSEVPSTSRFTSSNQSTNRPTTNSNSLDELYMSMVGEMDEDEALELAIQESVNLFTTTSERTDDTSNNRSRSPEEMRGLVSAWADGKIIGQDRKLIISRNTVFKSSLMYFKREAFIQKTGPLKVSFTSDEGMLEDAADAGGPRREYFRLLWQSIIETSGLLTGSQNRGYTLRPNFGAQARGEYIALGAMMATGIMQGAEAPAFFIPSVVDKILDTSTVDDLIEDIVEDFYREQLKEIELADNEEMLSIAVNKSRWWEEIDGIMPKVQLTNRNDFINIAASYLTTLRCSQMIEDLKKGLQTYSVLQLAAKENLRELFEYKKNNANSSEILAVLKPRFSHDPKKREKEEMILVNFHHFITSVHDKELQTVLKDGKVQLTEVMSEFIEELEPKHILIFATGAGTIPTTGFHPKPAVTFHHDETQNFPCAVTCSNELQLFVNAQNMDLYAFSSNFLIGLMNGRSFSKC